MVNKKYKLSIIIAMYNSEKYIANCLNSILDSDLPKGEFEVIIINDGSKDCGPEIAQEYCAKQKDFVYLSQENQGQSVARNYGIKEASGEYIWCVDSDDMLVADLNYIFSFLKNHLDADIIKTQIKTFKEGQHVDFVQKDGKYFHNSGRGMLLSGYHPQSLCNMIVRKSIFTKNHLKLIKGIVSEDTELSHKVYAFAKSVYTFNYITYLYLFNPLSTTNLKDKRCILREGKSNIIISKSFRSFSTDLKDSDSELSSLFYYRSNNILLGMLLSMISQRKERKGSRINQEVLEEMKKQEVYPLKGSFDTFKKTICAKVLNIELLTRLLI